MVAKDAEPNRTFSFASILDDDAGLFALLCERRDWDDDYLIGIESSVHDELLDCSTMVDFLESARAAGRKVTIAPDFDMDGIASGVLGYAGLRELGFDVELHLPDYRRGHDLTPQDIEEIAARWPATSVLLTCDGGVNSHEGIAAAHARGWSVLVTDHHQELEPGCTADITVDPCRMDETYAHPGICGAHVLYQVLEAYASRYRPEKVSAVRWLRLFAGLGTVSDVMPVLFENRQLVRDSLSVARLLWSPAPLDAYGDPDPAGIDVGSSAMMRILRAEAHDPVFVGVFEGFGCVLKAFAEQGKLRDVDDLDEGFYGFYLAPAMNSPRRTEAPLVDCFAAFLAPDVASKLAAMGRVIANNELRKELTTRYTEELGSVEQPLAPFVYFSDAPKGMLGLLANQLLERSGVPTVVVNPPSSPVAQVSGSARAPGWFDVIATLGRYEGLDAVGHAQACGVRADSAASLEVLAAVLEQETLLARLATDAEDTGVDLILGPDEDCDAPLSHLEPVVEMVRRMEGLRPFGQGFEEPVFQVVVEPARCALRRIGTEEQHLRLVTGDGLACLWWNAAEAEHDRLADLIKEQRAMQEAAVAEGRVVPVLPTIRFNVRLQLNHWNGMTRLQAVVSELVEQGDAAVAA